jgi:sodium-independent sulfate anion transporter 11
MRNGFVVILYTAVAYAVRDTWQVNVAGNIPAGFSGIVQPNLTPSFFLDALKAAPTIILVSILEHIAVVKAYGRINGYKPNDNQEFLALGVSNLLGSFVGAYPATGSFSRSAIKSQSGVRTPLAAFFTGIIVLLALFFLTPAFYWIPNSVLSAVIVAAISELLSPPSTIKALWDIQFIDFLGFLIALLVTFFSSIENGIYSAVIFSVLVLLVRVARPQIRILGRTNRGLWVDAEAEGYALPPNETLVPPPEGVLVFRVDEALTYPNATFMFNGLKEAVLERFRYTGKSLSSGDRLWSDNTEEISKSLASKNGNLPPLKAVIFDFSAVNFVDYTGVQALLDVKEDLNRFAGHDVPFHFAHVRRSHLRVVWRVPSVSAASTDVTNSAHQSGNVPISKFSLPFFKKAAQDSGSGSLLSTSSLDSDFEKNGRFFHLSLDDAVEALIANGDISDGNVLDKKKRAWLGWCDRCGYAWRRKGSERDGIQLNFGFHH